MLHKHEEFSLKCKQDKENQSLLQWYIYFYFANNNRLQHSIACFIKKKLISLLQMKVWLNEIINRWNYFIKDLASQVLTFHKVIQINMM